MKRGTKKVSSVDGAFFVVAHRTMDPDPQSTRKEKNFAKSLPMRLALFFLKNPCAWSDKQTEALYNVRRKRRCCSGEKMTPNELKNKTNKELSDLVDDNEAALAADPDDFRAECNLTMVRSEIGKRAMPIVLAVYLID